MPTTIATTDLSLGAYWAAHDLPFTRAVRDPQTGQVTFEFSDDAGRGTTLAGAYTLDERFQRYSLWRGRLAGMIRRFRDQAEAPASDGDGERGTLTYRGER